MERTLTANELEKIDAYFRASNYLAAGELYLKDNPLLKEPLKINKEIRQITEAKKLISLELNSLYEKKDLAKLKYLYYEYKKEKIDDLSLLYTNLKLDLGSKFNPEILKLYYIIKLSYHNV